MKIETRDFGILDIEENNIITFKQPLFGFEEYTQYVLVNDSNMGNGICWLQSIEQKNVCFITVSYTHLDVYKRQDIRCLRWIWIRRGI